MAKIPQPAEPEGGLIRRMTSLLVKGATNFIRRKDADHEPVRESGTAHGPVEGDSTGAIVVQDMNQALFRDNANSEIRRESKKQDGGTTADSIDACVLVDKSLNETGHYIFNKSGGGSFAVLRKLGQGGMGAVYEATRLQDLHMGVELRNEIADALALGKLDAVPLFDQMTGWQCLAYLQIEIDLVKSVLNESPESKERLGKLEPLLEQVEEIVKEQISLSKNRVVIKVALPTETENKPGQSKTTRELLDTNKLSLENEIIISSRMPPSYFASLHDWGFHTESRNLFAVYQYIEGVSVGEFGKLNRLSNQAPEPDLIALLLDHLCIGGAQMHKDGVIHRDISPGNLQASATDRYLKILDQGLSSRRKLEARQIGKANLSSRRKPAGCFIGKANYTSPDQSDAYVNESEISPEQAMKGDVWATSAVLYEVITGTHPYKATKGNWLGILLDQAQYKDSSKFGLLKIHKILPYFPKRLSEIIHMGLDPDFERRPSMAQLEEALRGSFLFDGAVGSQGFSMQGVRVRYTHIGMNTLVPLPDALAKIDVRSPGFTDLKPLVLSRYRNELYALSGMLWKNNGWANVPQKPEHLKTDDKDYQGMEGNHLLHELLKRREPTRKYAYDRATGIDWGLGNTIVTLKEAMLPACVPFLVDDYKGKLKDASIHSNKRCEIRRFLDQWDYGHENVKLYWQLRDVMEEIGLRMSDKRTDNGRTPLCENDRERLLKMFFACDDKIQTILREAGEVYDKFHERDTKDLAFKYFVDGTKFHDRAGSDVTEQFVPCHSHERLLQTYLGRLEMHPEIKK